MESPHFQQYPALAVKIWIGIGVFGIALWVMAIIALQGMVQSEYQRFVGCKYHLRTPCDSSQVWDLFGWSLTDDGTSVTSTDMYVTATTTAPIVAPKPTAPTIPAKAPAKKK